MSELLLPETGLGRVEGLLDPADPFDMLVIEFKEEAENDTLPTQAEQRVLLNALRKNGESSDDLLEQTHEGFIAAAAYPFKPYVGHEELAHNSVIAFRAAAKTYDLGSDEIFYDYAIIAMRRLLAQKYPAVPVDADKLYPEQPMESLLHLVANLRPMSQLERSLGMSGDETRQKLVGAGLSEGEWAVLPDIHLFDEETAIGGDLLSSATISDRAYDIRRKLGVGSRYEVALLALNAGFIDDLVPLENAGELSIRQRLVASRVHRHDSEIAEELGLSVGRVSKTVSRLYRETGARSRIELFLIAYMHGLEPSEEELAAHNHPALQEFTEYQRPILALAHLSNKKIAERLSMPEASANETISRIASKLGFSGRTSRTALVLELNRRGFQFDIRKPLVPLAEILSVRELEAGRMLDLPNPEIAKAITSDTFERTSADSLIHRMKVNTGARTRAELALQIRMYDTGQGRPEHTNALTLEARFFGPLGVSPRPMEETRGWLGYATLRQAEFLSAFYYSEERISMDALAKRYGVTRSTLATTMERGLKNIKRGLEEGLAEETDDTA